MPYATPANVASRLGGRSIGASTAPTSDEVTAWIAEHEAELDGHLSAAGFTVPVSGASPLVIVRSKITAKVASRVLDTYGAGTDMEESDLAPRLQKEWDDFIALISERPGTIGALIGQSISSSSNRGNFRSHVKGNSRGLSVGDGDFDPEFRKDDEN